MKRLQVRDVMTSDVVVVRLCTPFADVARLLVNRRLNAMPVLDGGSAVAGVVSVADLLHKEGHRDDPVDGHAYRRRDRVARTKAAACYAARLMTAPARGSSSPTPPPSSPLTSRLSDGVVSLSATVERRSDATTVERLAHRVAGVIDVRSRITYDLDDTTPMCPGF